MLRRNLENYLPLLDRPTPPKTADVQLDALLKILHQEGERERAVAAAEVVVAASEAAEEGSIEEELMEGQSMDTRDDARTPTEPQEEKAVDNPEKSPERVEEALRILVRNVTEEFGFAPRDVYRGIFDLPWMRQWHTAAVNQLTYNQLQTIVSVFINGYKLESLSDRIVSVYPLGPAGNRDTWGINFKSIRIAAEVMDSMRLKKDERMRQTYDTLHSIPESSLLAGWVFKAVVHRAFTIGSTLLWDPMDSDEGDPPTFSTPDGSLPSSSPSSPSFPVHRVDIRVDFNSDLSDVTLDSNRYYIPTVSNHSLFDSFIINIGANNRHITISILQITISSTNEGLAKGYFYVRQIKTRVRELLKEAGHNQVEIEVEYCLVCPDDGSHRRWEMPAGWSATRNNHNRGKPFCIRVPSPAPVRRVCSAPIL